MQISLCQGLEHRNGLFDTNASISDALAVCEVVADLLGTFHEEALNHHAHDSVVGLAALLGDICGDEGLVFVVLVGVAVAAVDHQACGEIVLAQKRASSLDGFSVVVGAGLATAPKNDVAVFVAGGLEEGRDALLGDGREPVRLLGSDDGVDGALDVAFGGVFEADGHRESAAEFAVDLTFGGSGADGDPTGYVRDVLGELEIEVLGSGGQAESIEIDQQLSSGAKTLIDVVALVEIGVVDKAFPANAGSGLFEVSAHEDDELVFEALSQREQLFGVIEGCDGVVDATRSHDDDETLIASVDDIGDRISGISDAARDLVGEGHFLMENRRRDHWAGVDDS